MTWKTLHRPGQFGNKDEELRSFWNSKYGKENWRGAYIWGDIVITRPIAMQIFEDGYYEFYKSNPAELDWLVTTASNICDDIPHNVKDGFDFDQLEVPDVHLHDVIRRVALRLGLWLEAERLNYVHWTRGKEYKICAGVVPFHLPKMIVTPRREGWWYPDTIEDFYQSNHVIQIKE